jgi:triacylglycerol esterase/lipase EstA (alpha/beta hydrolase family)
MRTIRLAVVAGVTALAFAVTPSALTPVALAAGPYPVRYSLAEGIAASLADPSAPAPGVNVACTPSAAHPRPVVLVNGTFANMTDDWSYLGPRLANAGYCVYSTVLGGDPHSVIQTTGPVATSVAQLASFVDGVRTATGVSTVDLVGHSQGGLIAEYYTKFLGAGKVSTVVGLSPTTHGTTLNGLATLAALFPGSPQVIGAACPACADQLPTSAVVTRLNTGPIAQPGVSYTIIETLNEFVVTPAGAAAFIREPGVRNLWVQNYCWFDTVDHASLSYDRTTEQLVRNALDPAHAIPAGC